MFKKAEYIYSIYIYTKSPPIRNTYISEYPKIQTFFECPKYLKTHEIPRQQLHYVSISLNTTLVYCCHRVLVVVFVPQFTVIDTLHHYYIQDEEEEEPGKLLLLLDLGRLLLLLLPIYIPGLMQYLFSYYKLNWDLKFRKTQNSEWGSHQRSPNLRRPSVSRCCLQQ